MKFCEILDPPFPYILSKLKVSTCSTGEVGIFFGSGVCLKLFASSPTFAKYVKIGI